MSAVIPILIVVCLLVACVLGVLIASCNPMQPPPAPVTPITLTPSPVPPTITQVITPTATLTHTPTHTPTFTKTHTPTLTPTLTPTETRVVIPPGRPNTLPESGAPQDNVWAWLALAGIAFVWAGCATMEKARLG